MGSSIKELQERAWQNKINHGFDLENVNHEFCLLYGEVAEAFDAYNKKLELLEEELADIGIYLFGLSKMLNIDLEDAILKKMAKNEKRVSSTTKRDFRWSQVTDSNRRPAHYE